MTDRIDVAALRALLDKATPVVSHTAIPVPRPLLRELLRVYQAVADAPEGEVVESGWDDDDERDGSVYGIASAMIGQRVRLVPSSGEGV